MKYRETRRVKGELEYLGMKLRWRIGCGGKRWFETGVYFRDEMYPIRILRYPHETSVVSTAQQVGVLRGQLIRAQRLCSMLGMFKEAVVMIIKSALRRGYTSRVLCGVFGRFLAKWWRARELRRGELRH